MGRLRQYSIRYYRKGGLTLVEVDIHTDTELQEKYGIRIPVVALANGEEKGWPFTAAQIGRLLDGAG